jgi:hypothetical protein
LLTIERGKEEIQNKIDKEITRETTKKEAMEIMIEIEENK